MKMLLTILKKIKRILRASINDYAEHKRTLTSKRKAHGFIVVKKKMPFYSSVEVKVDCKRTRPKKKEKKKKRIYRVQKIKQDGKRRCVSDECVDSS